MYAAVTQAQVEAGREALRGASVILLDLFNTLVVPEQRVKDEPFIEHIRRERYREWVRDLCVGRTVVLITARHERYRGATLRRMREVIGWEPDYDWFNPDGSQPPVTKRQALELFVYPTFGSDPSTFVAIESNGATRAMYAKQGIRALDAYELIGTPRQRGPKPDLSQTQAPAPSDPTGGQLGMF